MTPSEINQPRATINGPYRRCAYLDERGQQCETWFLAIDTNRLCAPHREIATPNSANSATAELQKVQYIDLVNDERKYCYHFLDGTAQEQKQTLIHEFKDDIEGTVFEKIDAHIAFLEKVIEDVKARLHSARAVRAEKLDAMTEEQRRELRKVKIERAVKPAKEKAPTIKSDPIQYLAKKGMSTEEATSLLTMDVDALIAKFEKAKEKND